MAEYTRSLGRIGEPPVRVGADVANLSTAIFASQAVIAALLARARTGRGQRVSVSMLGTLLHLRGIMWTAMSDPDDWWGFHLDHYTNPPETGYETADGRIFFGLRRGDSDDFDTLMLSLGLQDHIATSTSATSAARLPRSAGTPSRQSRSGRAPSSSARPKSGDYILERPTARLPELSFMRSLVTDNRLEDSSSDKLVDLTNATFRLDLCDARSPFVATTTRRQSPLFLLAFTKASAA